VTTEVVVEISQRRASIGLNRPEKLNALDLALVTALEEEAQRVGADPDIDLNEAAQSRPGVAGRTR
jgi:enoyl-CoA hydratase/carnithine racemase